MAESLEGYKKGIYSGYRWVSKELEQEGSYRQRGFHHGEHAFHKYGESPAGLAQ